MCSYIYAPFYEISAWVFLIHMLLYAGFYCIRFVILPVIMYILFMFLYCIYCFWWPLSLGKFIPVARSSSSYLFICLYVHIFICCKIIKYSKVHTLCNITPPYAERRVMFGVMKVGCYVTVDDNGNYVTFHKLNVRVKIKEITNAQSDSLSNHEF